MRFPTIILLASLSPLVLASETISQCATIENAEARLDCYDGVVGQSEPEKTLTVPATVAKPGKSEEEDFTTLFGSGADDSSEPVMSRIESIRQSSGGHRIMTLENGQVWMEREPGRRRIQAGQDIEIVKRRWSYSMLLLDQNRRVTVQRLE
jgi:hypothetical protein